MNLEVKKLLQDILDSIVIIESHLQNIPSLSIYIKDVKTMDAVERLLAIIGEALWKADKKDNTLNISSKNKVVSLRHIIVHDYDIVEDSSIWIICKNHLPILKEEVEKLLKQD
jgi:uncharacterized protein with HEPN domain